MPTILGRDFTRQELARKVGDFSQIFGVELLCYGDGLERGLRVLRFRTGSGLSFDILVDRAMDLAGMNFRGLPVGWHSPAGFRSPWLHEVDSEDGLGWMRSFSGMMNTCGLDHIMAVSEDGAEHYCYPDRARVVHNLHGRISYTPARLTGYGERWEGDRCFLYAEGQIRQSAMYAENLMLERRIEAEVGTDTLTIRDRVTNLGYYETPHAMLYHINLSWPLLDEGTRLIAPIKSTPWTCHDPNSTRIWALEQAGPQDKFYQQVYEHELEPGPDGMAHAALLNENFISPGGQIGLGLEIAYDPKNMPAMFQWQNLQEGNYVVALEPATVHGGSRADWLEREEMQILQHDEARGYTLSLTAHGGSEAVEALKNRLSLPR